MFSVNGGACGAGSSYNPTPHYGGSCAGGGAVTPSYPSSCGGGYTPPSTPPACGGGYSYTPSYGGGCSGGTLSSSTTSYTPTCGGGYNSPMQGSFGYITDKATREKTMQSEGKDDVMNDGTYFRKEGCKMTAFSKILSTLMGKNVSIQDVNKNYDYNSDGYLTQEEIKNGIQENLDIGKKLSVDYWEITLDKSRLDSIIKDSGTTYVLGKAEDVARGSHWIVLEGYNVNSNGQVEFSYCPSSDYDCGRKYILGELTSQQKENNYYRISKIETYNIK